MPLTAYDPCPCGSGKKLKFCCHAIADEMDRAMRLMDGNQPRVALQQLDTLSRKHPDNPWIETSRALILMELKEAVPARDIMRSLLEKHPDHEFAIVLYGAATFQADGLEAAKKPLHRAFQRSAKKFPSMVSGLAATMAAILVQEHKLIAAREHLALALRLSPEERRQELFVQLLEFDGDEGIPYPLRGSHVLPAIQGTEDQQKEIKKAQKYAGVGCWSTAADLFHTLTRTIPDSAELWQSVGLCRAWDGDEIGAAEALHRAAQLSADYSTAVEFETLAQHFDRLNTKDVIDICTYEGNVDSIGRLLTVLDEQPRFLRVPVPEPVNGEPVPPVAAYQVLDRNRWEGSDFSNLNLETIPKFQAHVSIYDADPDSKELPSVFLTGDRGADLEDARQQLDAASAGQVQWRTDRKQPEVTGTVPAESQSLRWRWTVPANTPVRINRQLRNQQWEQILNETWPKTSQTSLGGRTPVEASTDPAQAVPLAAAIYVLDSHCQQQSRDLDVAAMLSRFNLQPLAPLSVDESTQVNTLTVMQLHRLPLERLTDEQLVSVDNRAMLTRHEGFLYQVLKVVLNRPGCEPLMDMPRQYRAMIEVCARSGKKDEALHWIEVLRTKPPQEVSRFEYLWNCDITELAIRLEDPSDPGLKPLLDRFVHYYSPKLPQMRDHVERMLESYGVPSPWTAVSIVTSESQISSSVWSPEAPEAAAGSSKLWLPGQ